MGNLSDLEMETSACLENSHQKQQLKRLGPALAVSSSPGHRIVVSCTDNYFEKAFSKGARNNKRDLCADLLERVEKRL